MTATLARPATTGRRHFGDDQKRARLRGLVEALAELRLGRTLTAAEHRVDLLAIDTALERGKVALRDAIEQEKTRAIKHALAHQSNARLSITESMRDVLRALHDVGKLEALAELRALGVTPVEQTFAVGDEPWLDELSLSLQRSLNGIGYRIERELTPLSAMDMSRVQIAAAAERRVPGALDAASRLVSGALATGTGDVFGTNRDLIERWEYSAVSDGRTCSECRSHDGDEYDTWDDAQAVLPGGGPNPSCFGDGRCRCRLLPAAPADTTIAGPQRVDEAATYDVSLIPEYARDPVRALSVAEAKEQRSRLGSYYRTLKGHMDAGRRTRIPGKLEAMEARLADLDRHIASGGVPTYDVSLLPDYARAKVDTLTLEAATEQHSRLSSYYRTLKGHADAGRRKVAPGKVEAMEARLKDLERRIGDLGGTVTPTPTRKVTPTPRVVEPEPVAPTSTTRTPFAQEIDRIARDAVFPDTPARIGSQGVVPTRAQRDAHEAVMAAGQRVSREIEARVGSAVRDLNDAVKEAEERVRAARVEVVRINGNYGARIRQVDLEQNELLATLRNRIAREEFGVPYSQLPKLEDSAAVFKLARAQPEYTALDVEANRLREEWNREIAPHKEALDKAHADRTTAAKAAAEAERAAILDVLGEVREMGGAEWTFTTPGTRGKAKQRLNEAATYYPRDWITGTKALDARLTKGRGFFEQRAGAGGKVNIDDDLGTAIHELGHAQEWRDPRISSAEQAFYEWRVRARSWDGERERATNLGRGYRRAESARSDEFSDRYMGKTYDGRFYELLTMGLDSLWRTGSHTLDEEYRQFILGILAIL